MRLHQRSSLFRQDESGVLPDWLLPQDAAPPQRLAHTQIPDNLWRLLRDRTLADPQIATYLREQKDVWDSLKNANEREPSNSALSRGCAYPRIHIAPMGLYSSPTRKWAIIEIGIMTKSKNDYDGTCLDNLKGMRAAVYDLANNNGHPRLTQEGFPKQPALWVLPTDVVAWLRFQDFPNLGALQDIYSGYPYSEVEASDYHARECDD